MAWSNQTDEKKIMKKIAETSEVIRAKHKALKENKMDNLESLNEIYQPIVAPLKKLVSATEHAQTVNVSDDDVEMTTNVSAIQPIRKRLQLKSPVQSKKLRFTSSTPTCSGVPPALPAPPPQPSPSSSSSEESSSLPPLGQTEEFTTITSPPSPPTSVPQSSTSVFEQSLREIVQKYPDELKKMIKHLGPIGREYMTLFLKDTSNSIDNVFGVKFKDDELMMGSATFNIDENDNIFINGKQYRGTRGLFELIFKRHPLTELYSAEDLDDYKQILIETNAHRQQNLPTRQLLSNKGIKYKKIIAPLFSLRKGRGFGDTNIVTRNTRDYVYWDDPNELVDRLRLLIASQAAGHMGHENEITSIVEELREADLIV